MSVYKCNGTNIFFKVNGTIRLLTSKKIFVPLQERENIDYLFYITAKLIFVSKTKLPMFNPIHSVIITGKCKLINLS